MMKWNRIKNTPCLPLGENGMRITGSKEHALLSKSATTEGIVLLKNEDNVLPLKTNSKVALIGKGCAGYVEYGGGSGRVSTAYCKNICDGLEEKENDGKISLYKPLNDLYRNSVKEQYENGTWPGKAREPKASKELIYDAASKGYNTAIITISRRTCEGFDVNLEKEDNAYFLWDEEKEIIEIATQKFDKIIVILNIATVFDLSWCANNPKIKGILLIWNAGIEGGSATADIICGDAYPSGKLTDTFANIYDYPSTESYLESKEYVEYTEDIYIGYRYFETIPNASQKVIYPFGYGLSYTDFEIYNIEIKKEENTIRIKYDVKNIGEFKGKEVVQIYTSSPNGKIEKPKKELRAFKKTKELIPGETEHIEICFEIEELVSYDEQTACYILEKGKYVVLLGTAVNNIVCKSEFFIDEDYIVKQCKNLLTPKKLSKRLNASGFYIENNTVEYDTVLDHIEWPEKPTWSIEHIIPDLRSVTFPEGRITLNDVAEGKNTIDELISQLSIEELITLVGGRPNKGISNTYSMGDLESYGIPPLPTADGPAGLRIEPECEVFTTSWPCATLLACTWNTEIVESVARAGAMEVKENNFGMWLTPALNIHRNPLCGRNFEYFSEDPYISGKMSAAIIKGVQSTNISACIKHFCCNNKEEDRYISDSRVSERALREIYLKGFEIAIKESNPWALMTSYNKMNGKYTSENKELLYDILRGEWGYNGLICSDWCNYAEHYREILAGNNVRMPTGSNKRLLCAFEEGLIKREDLEDNAKYVLSLLLKID